jgi:hypothetical protein
MALKKRNGKHDPEVWIYEYVQNIMDKSFGWELRQDLNDRLQLEISLKNIQISRPPSLISGFFFLDRVKPHYL